MNPIPGETLHGSHLIAFSTSIDNHTSVRLTKPKVRAATLWLMMERSISFNSNVEEHPSDIVQLQQLKHEQDSRQTSSENTFLLKNLHNQLQKRQKKRKRKGRTESDSNLYHLEENSYNHITNDNHIITNNRNEKTRKKVKSINLDGNFRYMHDRKTSPGSKMNVTLWIFRIRSLLKQEINGDEMDDKVRSNFASPFA